MTLEQKLSKLLQPNDAKKASFFKFTCKTTEDKKYSLKNIINMDKVPLTFDCPPNCTIDTCNVKSVSITTTSS